MTWRHYDHLGKITIKKDESLYKMKMITRKHDIPNARTELFKQGLLISGPKVKNMLPLDLRSSESLAIFKNKGKGKGSHNFDGRRGGEYLELRRV